VREDIGQKNNADKTAAETVEENRAGGSINPLREAPVGRLILRLSVPAVVAMLCNAVYNIVDRAFIGHAPSLAGDGAVGAVAALQFCFPPMMITFGVALIFGIGGSILYSIALGKRDYETAKAVMHTAFGLSIAVFAVLLAVTVVFTPQIMALFIPPDTPAATAEMAVSYFRITSCSMVFQAVNVFGNNFIRANGNPITSMAAIMLAAAINVLLDYVFIFPLNWGIEGAALATVIAQACSTAWVLYYFFGKKNGRFVKTARFRLEIKKIRISAGLSRKIIAAGFSAFVFQAASSILTIVLTFTVSRYARAEDLDAQAAVAAIAVINAVQTLLLMPLTGLNQGLNPIIGYNYGARQFGRAKRALMLGTAAGTAFALVVWGATRLFPSAIIGFFTPDAGLVDSTRIILDHWLLATLLLGITVVGGNYFQATGKAGRAMFLSLARQVLIVVPLILLLPLMLGYEGIFYAQPISDAVVTLATAALLSLEFFVNPKYRKKERPAAGA